MVDSYNSNSKSPTSTKMENLNARLLAGKENVVSLELSSINMFVEVGEENSTFTLLCSLSSSSNNFARLCFKFIV